MAFVRKLAQEHLLERAFALCQDAGDATKRMKPGRARMHGAVRLHEYSGDDAAELSRSERR
jgi:hypothetical protein